MYICIYIYIYMYRSANLNTRLFRKPPVFRASAASPARGLGQNS